MKMTVKEDHYEIKLSERNLLSLLSKLHTPGSACTLESNDLWYGDVEGYGSFRVIAESDGVHYDGREFPPGAMHPHTEEILKFIKDNM